MSSSKVKKSLLERVQLYLWLFLAVVSLGWGFFISISTEQSHDLRLVHLWLRKWLLEGSHVYSLDDFIGTNYPPHAIVALSPLALIPESWLIPIWGLVNLALAPMVGYLAFRVMKPEALRRAALLPCAMFLSWAALRNGIELGQFTLLTLGLGLLAVLFEEKRPILGGLFLALALMKPHIGAAFFLWALFTKRWKMALVACLCMGLGVLLFSLRLAESPIESVRAYLGVLQYQFGRGVDAQGFLALRWVELRPLVALFIPSEIWTSRIDRLLLIVMLACAGAVGLMKSALNKQQRDAAVLQLCCLWLLMGVFHNPYDSILLLPVLMGLWATSVPHPSTSKRWLDRTALWVLQIALVMEVPGLWWKLSKTINLSSLNWAGLLLENLDRLVVLGLFLYLLNRVRLYWSARRELHEAGELLAQSSTPRA